MAGWLSCCLTDMAKYCLSLTATKYLIRICLLCRYIYQTEVDFEAISVGAILSDYQRVRVENVCSRLGLISLAYLWRRDQKELLQEMIDSRLHAIIIKVSES